jgi:ArsR family transcriptional regulator
MDDLLALLRAAAEPTRLRLIALCAESDLTVSELTQILGQSQPRLSRHLKLLCDAGLLERTQEGVFAFFRIAARGKAGELARQLIAAIPAEDAVRKLDSGRLAVVRKSRAVTAESYFQQNAPRWDAIRSLHIPEAKVEAALRRLLPERKVGDLIDLGTGTGRMLQLCAEVADRAVGIDRSSEMLAIARANLDQPRTRHCSLRRAEIEQLPFADASFDLALCHMVLHFCADPPAAIREAARVLKPGGEFLLIDFAPHREAALARDFAHRWPGFEDAKVSAWLRAAGFDSVSATSLPGRPLTVRIWRARRAAATLSRPRAAARKLALAR